VADPRAEFVKRIFRLAVRLRINEARMRRNLRRWDMNGPNPNLKAGRKFIEAAQRHQHYTYLAAQDGITETGSETVAANLDKLTRYLERQEREAK
jgi:hypothetical protein